MQKLTGIFEIFEYLKKYKKENITVVLPLAYGDAENAEKIKEEALNIFGKNKVEFWEDFVTYEEYARRIHGIDIAIIDNIYSNGLGNWALLTFFQKKRFISIKKEILLRVVKEIMLKLIIQKIYKEKVLNNFPNIILIQN